MTDPQTPTIVAPQDATGRDYDFEVVADAGATRHYAHTIPDLLDGLIPNYGTLDATGQWEARLHYATTAQVILQAYLSAEHDLSACSWSARAVLSLARDEQPSVAAWDEPVPLVLLATAYEPAGAIPRPRAVDGRDPNLVWVDPSDEESLLLSLHDAGYLVINVRAAEEVPDALP